MQIFVVFVLLLFLSPSLSWTSAAGEWVFNYKLLSRAQVIYCGISNNPHARMEEHKAAGKFHFDEMIVYFLNDSRASAFEKETECIYSHFVPRLFQTYPRDEKAIREYRSKTLHDDPKTFNEFIPVFFTEPVKKYLRALGIDYKKLYSPTFKKLYKKNYSN